MRHEETEEFSHGLDMLFANERRLGQPCAIQAFCLFDAVVIAVIKGQAEARVTDKWEALLGEPGRLDYRYSGEIGRRIADDRTVQLFGTIQVALLLTNERQALHERHIKGTFFGHAVLSRKGGSQNGFSLHVFRIPD